MSLERQKAKDASGFIKGAVFGAALLGAGGAGVEAGAKSLLDRINEHPLTPRIVQTLKAETGATDSDIAKLEARLDNILRLELQRVMRATQERS
jgi:hypothetical protein